MSEDINEDIQYIQDRVSFLEKLRNTRFFKKNAKFENALQDILNTVKELEPHAALQREYLKCLFSPSPKEKIKEFSEEMKRKEFPSKIKFDTSIVKVANYIHQSLVKPPHYY